MPVKVQKYCEKDYSLLSLNLFFFICRDTSKACNTSKEIKRQFERVMLLET